LTYGVIRLKQNHKIPARKFIIYTYYLVGKWANYIEKKLIK